MVLIDKRTEATASSKGSSRVPMSYAALSDEQRWGCEGIFSTIHRASSQSNDEVVIDEHGRAAFFDEASRG